MSEMFMIVPPVAPWDKPNAEKIMLDIGAATLAAGPGAAWFRHTRGDMSKVQAWFDRGYRLRRVAVTLLEEVAATGFSEGEAVLDGNESALCEDCPPIGYPTNKTRCAPCPKRAPPAGTPS